MKKIKNNFSIEGCSKIIRNYYTGVNYSGRGVKKLKLMMQNNSETIIYCYEYLKFKHLSYLCNY